MMLRRGGIKRGMSSMRRGTRIKKLGRVGEQRAARRKQWIEDHPPQVAADGRKFYMCHICIYFEEAPNVALVWFGLFVLEHVENKAQLTLEESELDANLAPAHSWCNTEKGSQALWQMKVSPQTGKPNPHLA